MSNVDDCLVIDCFFDASIRRSRNVSRATLSCRTIATATQTATASRTSSRPSTPRGRWSGGSLKMVSPTRPDQPTVNCESGSDWSSGHCCRSPWGQHPAGPGDRVPVQPPGSHLQGKHTSQGLYFTFAFQLFAVLLRLEPHDRKWKQLLDLFSFFFLLFIFVFSRASCFPDNNHVTEHVFSQLIMSWPRTQLLFCLLRLFERTEALMTL